MKSYYYIATFVKQTIDFICAWVDQNFNLSVPDVLLAT